MADPLLFSVKLVFNKKRLNFGKPTLTIPTLFFLISGTGLA
jgi:hypothetical protein